MLHDDPDVDPYLAKVMGMVEEFGWMIQAVGAGPDTYPFTYTVGMSRWQHAEFLLIGLEFRAAHTVLNGLAQRVADGERFGEGSVSQVFQPPFEPYLLPFTQEAEEVSTYLLSIARVLNHRYGWCEGFGRLQVVLPDEDNLLPWQGGWKDQEYPVLGIPPHV